VAIALDATVGGESSNSFAVWNAAKEFVAFQPEFSRA
jgi:hypothetical protein